MTHWSDFERIAIVGDLKKWQDMMVRFSSPFTKAELKSFGPEQLTDANAWLDS
ncbi:MAG: STAS/SEC14 domain-containing protein [Planctomycetota bacterium]|nr:STAS/SEC14 domain-containing protein [Planctomycetota bacterium]MDA1027061.1 STAS/SEC14 domain-containing protein [Planctomycetota bacterium]